MWPFRKKRPGVFYYKIGGDKKSIDGLEAATRLESHPEFLWEHIDILLKPIESDDPAIKKMGAEEQADAEKSMLAGFRDVFGWPRYDDGNGYSKVECEGVIGDFIVWLASLKKNIASSEISSPSSEPELSENSMPNSGSDYGSIPAEPSIAEPVSS